MSTLPYLPGHGDEDLTPDWGMSQARKAKVLRNNFVGYAQRIGDGINNVSTAPRLTWTNVPEAFKNELDAFLFDAAGAQAFQYLCPGETVPRKFTCAEWDPVPTSPGMWKITASLTEEFDL